MTIPNILSLFRIFLIPVFLIIYLTQDQQPYFVISALILLLSGITDVLDGYIARKYKMTSELGKVLDPFADKMTQIAILAALVIKHPKLLFVVAIYFAKELAMLIGGIIIIKNKIPMASSKWWGKIGTLLFYAATFVIVAFPDLIAEDGILYIVGAITLYMLFTPAMYIPMFFKLKKKSK